MNDKRFIDLIEQAKKMVADCGLTLPEKITYSLNPRLTKAIGRCQYTRSSDSYKIQMSTNYFNEYLKAGETEKILDTILHEMCHAMPGGAGHGQVWKGYAAIINRKFGFNIKRLADTDEVISKLAMERQAKVICNTCKNVYFVPKNGKVVKDIGRFRCKCKGTLRLVG